MPELWELCNGRSQAVLIQLYYDEHGERPDFFYVLQGERRQPDIIDAPDCRELEEMEMEREVSRPPESEQHMRGET